MVLDDKILDGILEYLDKKSPHLVGRFFVGHILKLVIYFVMP